jgi:DNA invertase Pin-like site-specific DNA recombinase
MDFGVSLPDQINRIKQRFPEATVYTEEGVSASKNSMEQRPASALLLQSVETGQVKTVVCTSLSRLFRSTAECLTTVTRWNKMGVTFVCLDLDMDTSKPWGFMMLTVIAACAQLEAALLGERTKAAMTHLKTVNPEGWTSKKSGRHVTRFGRVDSWDMFPEHHAAALNAIAKLQGQGFTLAECAVLLNQEGSVKPIRGDEWSRDSVFRCIHAGKP